MTLNRLSVTTANDEKLCVKFGFTMALMNACDENIKEFTFSRFLIVPFLHKINNTKYRYKF